MAFTYKDLQDEVVRRATRDQGGTQFTTAIQNAVNFALFRLARDGKWRVLRRKGVFETKKKYTTGSGGGTFTKDSKSITMVGATFLTDGINIGRKIKLQGDSDVFIIDTITGETTLTLTKAYGGTTISGTGTYSILGQEEYNLPVQCSHRAFLWHTEWGYPYQMRFVSDQQFYGSGFDDQIEQIPTHYRMWGEDMVLTQPKQASVVTVSSSVTADTNIAVTVFGTVSGYPDFEIITTNASDGTTAVAGSKAFSNIDRISKGSSSTGRITATSDSANTTLSVLPVGDTTVGIINRKVQLYPLPNTVFPMNVYFYKEPYRLVNEGDIHEMGQEFDEAIILLATSKLNYETNKDEGDNFFALYKDEVRSLKKDNVDKIDWHPDLRRGMRAGGFRNGGPLFSPSQAGAFFGHGTRL